MIELTSDIEIMNPEHHICTLDKGASLNVEFIVIVSSPRIESSIVISEQLPKLDQLV